VHLRIKFGINFQVEEWGKGLIGVDLFTGKRVFNNVDNEGKSLPFSDLKLNPVGIQPIFCVLGAGGYGVGRDDSYAENGIPTPNQTSILAMLFWPQNGKCSYFTGGDGFPLVERVSISGLLNHGGFMEGPVHVIKLDHHGSSRDLLPPLEEHENRQFGNIVAGFRPKKIIVTPGKRYGHPSI
jgi:hypothetical protein